MPARKENTPHSSNGMFFNFVHQNYNLLFLSKNDITLLYLAQLFGYCIPALEEESPVLSLLQF